MYSFLQSNEWAEFQRSLGREVLEYDRGGITAKIIKHNLPFGRSYLYIPHGPIIDFNSMAGGMKNPVSNFVRWLQEEAKRRKSIFVKAEPPADNIAQILFEHGFKKSKKEIQPSKTVIIGLEQSEDELLGNMHHKTRYNIKVAENHGVKVWESDDINGFWKLLEKTVKRDKFNPHPRDYYQKLLDFFKEKSEIQVKLFLAVLPISNSRELENKELENKREGERLLAGAIVLLYQDTAHYLHGASDYEFRSFMAPYALHWHIIKSLQIPRFAKASARRANSKFQILKYDLWGIDAHKWPGITRFKLGWGGRTIEYPGSFDLPVFKFWYLAYKIARKIF